MLMSWNFSQCFYYRPPVLNIFQSNTPKFHCLQWINDTLLSLKYHAFFNQAPGLKQKLLERYFFMIRTIRNLVAIMKGSSQSHAYIQYIQYVCVCQTQRETPGVNSDAFLSSRSELCVLTGSHQPWLWDLRRPGPKAVWTASTKEQSCTSLFHVLKVLAKL